MTGNHACGTWQAKACGSPQGSPRQILAPVSRGKRRWFGLIICLAFLWSGSALAAETSARPLFNGKDLSGFYTWLVDARYEDPRNVFSVTNGILRISGEGLGYLATREEFQNYHLTVEYRWGTQNWSWGDRLGKARDSGLFLHATGPDGNSHDGKGAFMAAIECNLFQGATGDFLLIRGKDAGGNLLGPRVLTEVSEQPDGDGWFTWQKGGRRHTVETWGRINWKNKDKNWRDELDFRGRQDLEKPPGEWNRIECLCREDRIIVKLNGVVVNEVFDIWPRRGKILLQCEGSEIFFRKVDLVQLEKDQQGGIQLETPGSIPAKTREISEK